MSHNTLSPANSPKRNRTKGEREEHAHYARLSVARKRKQGLVRACLWVPEDEKAYFERLAEASRTRHFAKSGDPVDKLTPKKSKRATKHKTLDDPRQGKLLL